MLFSMVKEADLSGASVGGRVRAARTRAGLTLEELSSQIGVSPATLSLIERERVSVTVERVSQLAEVLGLELEDLMYSGDFEPSAVRTGPGGREHAGAPHLVRGAPDAPHPKIVEAIIDCFVRWGYHGTSMRQIAQAGGVSVAGVYHYFTSKQQMLVSLMDETMAELISRLDDVLTAAEGQPVEERYRQVVRELALFHLEQRRKGFIGASEMRSIDEPDRSRIAGLRRDVQHTVDALAREGFETGAFTNPDWRFAGRVVSNMCTSTSQWYDPEGPVPKDAAADNLADYALAMMRVPGPGR